MKLAFAFLLLLLTQYANSAPVKVLSQVCDFRYAEGVKIEKSNGRIARVCLNKKFLEDIYPTDIESRCEKTHVEGRRVFSSYGFHYKLCLRRVTLPEIYDTFVGASCADDYSSDNISSQTDFDFASKVCVRNLI